MTQEAASASGAAMDQLLRGFTRDMERRALRPATIRRRRDILRTVHHELGHPLEVATEAIQQLLDRRSLAPRTRYTWISHLHAFYGWAIAQGHTAVDPTARIMRPKLDRLLPRPISDQDLALALEQAPHQMHAWIVLMAYAGLRCSEVAGLARTDILDAHRMLRVLGKGRRERMVPMHPLVVDTLARYPMARTGPVFRRPGGSSWPAPKVSRRTNVFLDELGIDATAHQFRHWFGTMVQAEGGDLRVTQELLGHANPGTTAGYAAFSFVRGVEAVSGLPTMLRVPAA
ncbi:MAG: tyrosine-type recombinase/integrase [Acidimicrobiia bacterium]|nr:tyrosine-type recombinase/integrase [Acidimicrobiia bacterium]